MKYKIEAKKYLKRNEILWESYYKSGKLLYLVITKGITRDKYILLDVSTGERKELGSNVNPVKLRPKMILINEG